MEHLMETNVLFDTKNSKIPHVAKPSCLPKKPRALVTIVNDLQLC